MGEVVRGSRTTFGCRALALWRTLRPRRLEDLLYTLSFPFVLHRSWNDDQTGHLSSSVKDGLRNGITTIAVILLLTLEFSRNHKHTATARIDLTLRMI